MLHQVTINWSDNMILTVMGQKKHTIARPKHSTYQVSATSWMIESEFDQEKKNHSLGYDGTMGILPSRGSGETMELHNATPSLREQIKALSIPQRRLKTKNLVTMVEAGVVVALGQASSDTLSLSGSSTGDRSCIRAGGLMMGLPWLDVISSVTAGISCGLLPSAS